MTVAAQTPITTATGNGVTTAFATAWKAPQSSDVVVKVDGVTQTLTTHYSLTGLGGASFTVTFVTAPASGAAVLIYRETAVTRTTDYQVAGDFLAPTVNEDFDRPIRILQDLQLGLLRSAFRLPVGDSSETLPAAADRANAFPHFDSLGTPDLVYAESPELASYLANWTDQTFTATAGQADFTLSGSPGALANLSVYVDGVRLIAGTDYNLPAAQTLRLVVPCEANQEVMARWGEALPQGTTTDAATNVQPYTLGAMVNLRKWLQGAEVSAGAPSDAIFSTFQDAISEANDRGRGLVFAGTWTVPAGLTIYSGMTIRGQRMLDSILKLGDGLDTHLIATSGLSYLRLSNLTLDGNKSNQTLGAVARCLYALDTKKVFLDHVLAKNAADHGVHVSTGATTDPLSDSSDIWVADSIFQDNGTTTVGGNGGSGLAATAARIWVRDSYGLGNILAGFKFTGREVTAHGLHAESNKAGGFTSGFDAVTEEGVLHVYTACRAIGNGDFTDPTQGGDGFRHQGQVDRIIHRDCMARANAWAGMALLASSTVKATNVDVYGGDYYNNGQAFTGSSTVSGAGLFVSSTVGTPNVPSKIRLQGVTSTDTQGTKTQTYGLEVQQGDDIWVGPGTDLSGNLTQSIRLTTTAATNVRISIDGVRGDFITRSNTAASVTGTTTETDLQSITIPASTFCIGQRYRVRARGTVSGTAGTKQLRLYWGSANSLLISQLAADQQEWTIDGTIEISAASSNKCAATGVEIGGQTSVAMLTNTTNISSAITCKVTGTLGSTADTITCSSFYFEPIY